MFQKELLYQTVELFLHVTNEQPEHICQLIFTLQDPTNNVQCLKEKEDVHELLQLLPLNKDQQGQGIGDIFHFVKKIVKSKVARNIGKMALGNLPGAVEKLSGKVKNKKLKKILGSENVKNLLNNGTAYDIKKLQ